MTHPTCATTNIERGANQWTNIPQLDLENVEKATFPKDPAARWAHNTFMSRVSMMRRRVRLCILSIDLVHNYAEGLDEFLQKVLAWHHYCVLKACEGEIQKASEPLDNTDPARSQQRSKELTEVLTDNKELEDRLAVEKHLQGKCPAWTMFHVVFAVLASRVEPGVDFAKLLEGKTLVSEWHEEAIDFLPNCAAFDPNLCLVETTTPQWPGWDDVLEWEYEFRNARIEPEVKEKTESARKRIYKRPKDAQGGFGNQDFGDFVKRGRELLEDDTFFQAEYGKWWTMTTKTAGGKAAFEHMSQCQNCQAMWKATALLVANRDPREEKMKGRKYGARCPWQCAEPALHSLERRVSGKAKNYV